MLKLSKVNARACMLAVAMLLSGGPAAAVNELGTLTLAPATVPAGAAPKVVLSVIVVDPNVDASSLKLTSVDPDVPGKVIAALGLLQPDGDDGMGHKKYSLTFPAPTAKLMQVQLTYAVGPMPAQRKACRALPVNPESGPLTDVTPAGITAFLAANADVKTAAQFLGALPAAFKQHWIFMTSTESAQQASAEQPRLLVPDADARNVFSFEIGSGGGRKPEEIEYISFDGKKFNFHAIDMTNRKLIAGANGAGRTCAGCHSGRPNWDAYDSWAGMLPYNRDRLYEGSIETAAFTTLLKKLRNDPLVSRLDLPKGFSTTCDGDVTVTQFNGKYVVDPLLTKPVPYVQDGMGGPLNGLKFPGDKQQNVNQGGKYIVLHHSKKTNPDEGRGVALFDNLSALNAQRIAADIVGSKRKPMDVRPIALAIAAHSIVDVAGVPTLKFLCSSADFTANPALFAPQKVLNKLYAYHGGMTLDDLVKDTKARRQTLAPEKANLQIVNLAAPDGVVAYVKGNNGATVANVAQEIFRRTKLVSDAAESGFQFDSGDTAIGLVIDRELYGEDNLRVALLRLFLQPAKFEVDSWSLSVSERSTTYTFGDVLTDPYLSVLQAAVTPQVTGLVMPATCAQLQKLSSLAYARALEADATYFDKPAP
jgi:hypothetical protein